MIPRRIGRREALMTWLTFLTWFHTALSLVMMLAGFVVVAELIKSRSPAGWTSLFLWTGVLTSATGFLFPFTTFLPSHWTGVISLIVLAVTIYARQIAHYAGAMRWIYAVGAVAALYLDVFVGVVQAFLKIPALNALAPTQGEPPFAI